MYIVTLLLIPAAYPIIFYSCKKEISSVLPRLSTTPLTNVTSVSADCGGIILSDGGDYILARGVCWNDEPQPTIDTRHTTDGEGTGSFSSKMTGLTDGTNYYVRAYATNSSGTSYGNEFIFITPMTDIDGNVYNTAVVGNQVWTLFNLKTTRLNNNVLIPIIQDDTPWSLLNTCAYCWYKNDESANKNIYGALYNWYAVNTGKLCPSGWHLPAESEWNELTNYLGGKGIASGKLKEQGTDHWLKPNYGATNDYGFSALPGGYRTGVNCLQCHDTHVLSLVGTFLDKTYFGWYWTSTEADSIGARARMMTYDASEIVSGTGLKRNGYSVRCVKNPVKNK
jgi:uncharacterized protein (TIGR02145 family)